MLGPREVQRRNPHLLRGLLEISTAPGKEDLFGKRHARTAHVNAVSGQNASLLHVWDAENGIRWLVDSGSLLSIIPPSPDHRAKGPDEKTLRAANGSTIACFGKASVHIVLNDRKFN